MRHRGQYEAEERQIRSKLAQIVSQKRFIRAGLVKMRRKCGKKNCRCAKDNKGHESYYLSMRVGRKRKMIYVPPRMEEEVHRWVASYKEISKAIEQVSGHSLKHLKEG